MTTLHSPYTRIGSHTACIAGDYRYSTTIDVFFDYTTKTGKVVTSENGAVGGMDGSGGAYPFEETAGLVITNCTAAKLATVVREACARDTVMAKYGKATKNFSWGSYRSGLAKGISKAKVQAALDACAP